MAKTFRFLDFQVYVSSKEFYKEISFLIKRFPREHFDLSDQLRRAALSVCLNIAEGSAKASDKDFNRYLGNSLGSVNEVVAGLDLALELRLINNEKFNEYVLQAELIAKQLGGFSKKLRAG